MKQQELLYLIALSGISGIGPVLAKNLIAYCGSAQQVFNTPKSKLEKIPLIGQERAAFIHNAEALKKAEEEYSFIEKHNITPLVYSMEDYPARLKNCADAPLLLYYKGNTNLNAAKTLAIVGTRKCTDYGKEVTRKIVSDLAGTDILVLSGLAYGIDIVAHQSALENGLPTVGVLGHGLNTIYPAQHKSTAKKMLEQGGLLTEYKSSDKMSSYNFPERNRIVAGMSDAVVVIESTVDGGAIITANIAASYHRDVFAIPGRVNNKVSAGCNYLIKTNQAALIETADDLLEAMCWKNNTPSNKKESKQSQLVFDLNKDEQAVYNVLKDGETDIDTLSIKTGMSTGELAAVLLEMEMNALLVSMPGKRYKWLH